MLKSHNFSKVSKEIHSEITENGEKLSYKAFPYLIFEQ